jgi:hypothetical protein
MDMPTLKTLLSRSTPTEPPGSAGTIPTDATDKAWGAYMTVSRAWKTKTSELTESRSRLAELDQIIGEKNADGIDASADVHARQSAHSLMTQLESAVAVLLQRKQAAEANWTQVKRQAVITADDEANTAFKASVLELEALQRGALKLAVDKVAAARLAVKDRSEGDSGVASALIDFDAWFEVYLRRDCSALIPGGRTYSKTLDEQKKPLSAWVDAVAYAMTYRRKGK